MEFEVNLIEKKNNNTIATLELESPMSDVIKDAFIELDKAYEEIVNSDEFSFEIYPIDDESERFVALMQHLNLGFDSFNDFEFDDNNTFILGNGEYEEVYKVLTDNEADDAYEEDLDYYIDEIILPEIPEQYHYYFDTEKWKDDARLDGSRGNSLASYDGVENEKMVDGTTYYIYRTN